MSELWLWGENYSGTLGDGTYDAKSSPVQTIAGGTDWKLVASGYHNTLAIKNDGSLWAWGSNNHGSLGDGTTNDTNMPIQIGEDKNWSKLGAGNAYWDASAAIKTDGTLYLWGYGGYGSLGNENTDDVSSPIQTVAGGTDWKQVSRAWDHTGAIKTDGTLWMWGNNETGSLADGTTDNKSSPVQTICGGNNWSQVSCNGYDSTTAFAAAIKVDGTLWTWGYNGYGQLGDGTTDSKSSPIQTMAGGTNWKYVSCGGGHIVAAKTDGTIWAWGSNYDGQLGDESTTLKSSPIQVMGSTWAEVSAGGFHTLARKTDGTIWAWGDNNDGQIGNSDTMNVSSPVQIGTEMTWTQVTAGYYHSSAIKNTETVNPITSCVKTVCSGQTGFACFTQDKTCTCAKWKYFYSNCSRIQNALGICSSTSGAYVPAITVCNQRLFN